MLNIEEIAREAALKSGTLLGKDDPILISLWINEKIIRHYADRLREAQTNQQKDVAVLIESSNEKAKAAASQAITKAGDYVHHQVLAASKQLSEMMGKELRAEGLVLLRELEQFRSGFHTENATLRHTFEKTGANVASQIRTFQWLSFGMTVLLAGLLGIWLGMNLVH